MCAGQPPRPDCSAEAVVRLVARRQAARIAVEVDGFVVVMWLWESNSVGRASASQAEGRGFDSAPACSNEMRSHQIYAALHTGVAFFISGRTW